MLLLQPIELRRHNTLVGAFVMRLNGMHRIIVLLHVNLQVCVLQPRDQALNGVQ